MSVDDLASGAKLAYWDLNKAAYQIARGTYKRAQNVGMRYQNWRHKGAGESDDVAPVRPTSGMNPHTGTPAGNNLPAKRQWTSDEESFSNTTYSETTYTRKRTR